MTGLISPQFSKLLAAAILLVAAWLAANVSYGLISGRLRLAREIEEARQRYEAIHKRRVDIPSLEKQLAELTTSSLLRSAAIAASSDSVASTRLQQLVRDGIDQVHGKLLSLNTVGADRTSSTVAVRVRARLDEPMVPTWIDHAENGEPRLYLEELSIAARPQPSEPALPIEMSATLRARWLPLEERKP